jgi:hypothetical protein
MITADTAADLGDGVSSHSENSENVTNEPEVDEKVFIAKPSGTVEVAANSTLHSGLDSSGSFVPTLERRHADGPRPCQCPQIENSENVTNEPEHPKNLIIANHQEPVEVTANPGMTSALDTALS